ncbi:MAG: acyltransferase [Crocinitomicaceae bacterium]|jgi:acetyltransferase-like isoleucine patch superfamily enzyme|nr:acyltransferase [Crocinitomicaceae bacterium]MDP4865926.1 acyltransferase [Crocinitomicaceae bacterium]
MSFLSYIKSKVKRRTTDKFGPKMLTRLQHNGVQLKDVRISESTVLSCPKQLNLEHNIFIGHYNFIEASNGITIEEGVQITNYISILSHSSHISIRLYGADYRKHKELIGYKKGTVHIGKYSFIGPHATIMPGTKIGKGCLIAAYSFVKGDFPDFSIIGGNPASVVGTTKDLDKDYLEQYPELQKFYSEWADR